MFRRADCAATFRKAQLKRPPVADQERERRVTGSRLRGGWSEGHWPKRLARYSPWLTT